MHSFVKKLRKCHKIAFIRFCVNPSLRKNFSSFFCPIIILGHNVMSSR